jgi:hypothetical protein
MCACLVDSCKPYPAVRIACIALLTLLSSGWSTCAAIVSFNSCLGTVPQPQIALLSPDTIPSNAESVQLIVTGSGFVPQSQILSNGSALQTTFTDSNHLHAIIAPQNRDSFGGSVESTVQISVRSQGSNPVFGCRNGGNSSTLVLVIN